MTSKGHVLWLWTCAWIAMTALTAMTSATTFGQTPAPRLPTAEEASISEIKATIERMKTTSSPQSRSDLAGRLAVFCRYVDANDFDQETIDEITDFLGDTDDTVRMFAATALGNIGPRARSAIHALEKALQKRLNETEEMGDLLAPAMDSSYAMEYALQKIRSTR